MKALVKGSTGSDVKHLQTMLNALGFSCGTVDGSFGNTTLSAVKSAQKKYGLTVDGSVGTQTWTKLQTEYAKKTTNNTSVVNPSTPVTSSVGSDKLTVHTYQNLKYIIVNPEDIMMVVANKKYTSLSSKTAINGTFFWAGNPNGIIVNAGKVLCDAASHAWRGYGQSVLYYDGKTIKCKRVKSASELGTVKWAIGGCGMITPNGYSPTSEGFNGTYADILRATYKTVMGVKDGKIYLIVSTSSVSHGTLLTYLKNMKLDYAISLDGSGSTVMKANGTVIKKSSDNRTINNWVVVK